MDWTLARFGVLDLTLEPWLAACSRADPSVADHYSSLRIAFERVEAGSCANAGGLVPGV